MQKVILNAIKEIEKLQDEETIKKTNVQSIEKLRGHLGNLWGQTSMSDVGSKSELDKALTELERLQKRDKDVKAKLIKRMELNKKLLKENYDIDTEIVSHLSAENTALELVMMLMDWSDDK